MLRKLYAGVLVALLIFFSLLPIKASSISSIDEDEGYDAISIKYLKAHLNFLASNLLEGREAASRGYDLAASYSVSLFDQWGLTPIIETNNGKSFLQTFPVLEITSKNNETLQIITNQNETQITQDFSNRIDFLISRASNTTSLSAPIVFAGYGLVVPEIKYDDYLGVDVKNKIVVVMSHAPGEGDEKSYFYKLENRNRFFNGAEVSEKQRNAQERGALAVLMVNDPLGKHSPIFTNFATNMTRKPANNINAPTPRRRMVLADYQNASSNIPVINISEAVAGAIFKDVDLNLLDLQQELNSRLKSVSRNLIGKQVKISLEVEQKLLNTTNVVGTIEGSDPLLKKEYVVIGAHLDHDGTRDGYIWNGADDDASGSSAVLELARAFSLLKEKPKRSIIFCLWGAEEKGLLGSEYFVERSPVPLEKISAMIQLDMIGRDVEPRPNQLQGKEKPQDLRKYIYTEIGTQAQEIGRILMQANKLVGLELNHEVNAKVSGGSDHYSFWKKKIPILSVDDGVFHPDYHQPSDTAEKINFEKMVLVTQLTYLVGREIANYPNKIEWDDKITSVDR
ncbi:MAG: M20/M25/M40 family metallo-hydrolase [Acidobacteria bacterium]|nr:M20/M25/M40 family metallo-hydrolase [Acidobacteriota bacterium]